jgi:hypothetical protein
MSAPSGPLEQAFDALGLMRGANAPIKRALVCAAVGGLAVTYLQPSSMFTGGVPRPWSVITKNPTASVILPTPTPWFFVLAALALIGGVLV